MPDVSVDNTPVTVALDVSETFTPASGTVIVANIQAAEEGEADIELGGIDAFDIVSGQTSNAESEISVVLTDQTTVIGAGNGKVFISGFKV